MSGLRTIQGFPYHIGVYVGMGKEAGDTVCVLTGVLFQRCVNLLLSSSSCEV